MTGSLLRSQEIGTQTSFVLDFAGHMIRALARRELHYAHSVDNRSSRRVTERLGPRRIGANLRMA